MEHAFRLKDGLLLGSASAAAQVEGGWCDTNWHDWYKRGKIKDGSNPARACDNFRLWREDNALMSEMGMQICRMGIEWARIEPEEGVFDTAALDHYLDILRDLNARGIRPLVTLWHFSDPMWFVRKGGFENPDNIGVFLRFAEKTVRHFGAECCEYITLNEPNVYAATGYFFGEWPPGVKSAGRTIRVMSVFAACHVLTYQMIHRVRGEMGLADTKVGYANHVRAFEPKNPRNIIDRIGARIMRRLFQGALFKASCTGRRAFPLKKYGGYKKGVYTDFIGINYYSRSAVSGFSAGFADGAPKNDLGWDIYPEGLVIAAKECLAVINAPIYITENGTCDNSDAFRARYICEHLRALCESGLPFERYYHWCFTDNFEWLEGESARFGLVKLDYETQTRTVKESGRFFSRVIAEKGVSAECYAEYVAGHPYPGEKTEEN